MRNGWLIGWALVPAAARGGCGGNGEGSSEASATPSAAAAANATPAALALASQAGPSASPPAFLQCRSCHSTEPGRNGIGPSLFGVYGRKAGSLPGFNYSAALMQSGITWNDDTLDKWLAGPMKMVPGAHMVVSVRDEDQRKQIIEYLEKLK
jgi:cytochrome c